MFEQAFKDPIHEPFRLSGGRSAALLVHGFPGSPAEMRPLAKLLNEQGWTVYGHLLPGFGPQIDSLPRQTLSNWMSSLWAIYQRLQREYDSVMLGGNSMGGSLLISLAARAKQRPAGLLLFAPFWKLDHIAWRALPLIRTFLPQPRLFRYLKLDFNDPDVRQGIQNFMPEADLDAPQVQAGIRDYPVPVKMFAQIHRAGHDAYRSAPAVRVPALVLQGSEDDIAKPVLTRALVARFSAPVRLVTVKADHNLLAPDRPYWDEITRAVQTFCERLLPETITAGPPF